jgi:hypothetical protein
MERSPISSRKMVPPSAASKRPIRLYSSSFPVPVSPEMRTVESVGATFVIARFPAIPEPGSCPCAPFDPALSAASSHPEASSAIRASKRASTVSDSRRPAPGGGRLSRESGSETTQRLREGYFKFPGAGADAGGDLQGPALDRRGDPGVF